MMPVASYISSPISAPCDDMLAMLVCATHWPSTHLHTLAHMFMHESCLLLCCSYFSIMKLWTSDLNLNLSPADTIFCLPSFLLACLLASLFFCPLVRMLILLLVMSPATCYACFTCMLVCFVPIAHYLRISFFPLLVCWFLVFAFACTHTK